MLSKLTNNSKKPSIQQGVFPTQLCFSYLFLDQTYFSCPFNIKLQMNKAVPCLKPSSFTEDSTHTFKQVIHSFANLLTELQTNPAGKTAEEQMSQNDPRQC